jgi:hypothetical protein
MANPSAVNPDQEPERAAFLVRHAVAHASLRVSSVFPGLSASPSYMRISAPPHSPSKILVQKVPAGANLPIGHDVQVPCVPTEYLPSGHDLQVVWPLLPW